MTVDVVVPAHTEAPRIAPVLAAICGSPAVGQLIVVADACSDPTAAIASEYATVVPIDAGTKGTAMATGLAYVTTPTVLFCDADLSGLRPEHVTALCLLPPATGMLVGVRGKLPGGLTVPKPLAAWPSISGERRLPVNFVRGLHLEGKGWDAETVINAAVVEAGLPHRQVILRGVSNPRKGPAKTVKEWLDVATATVAKSPELVRYVATET